MPGHMLVMMVTSLLCFVGFASSAFAECPSGQVSCNGKCVDLKSDEANCGSCGSTCKRAHACNQGSCQLECPDVQLACGNVCVTPASNPSHCGGCGKSCASNQYCSLGMCQQATCPEPKTVPTETTTKTTTSQPSKKTGSSTSKTPRKSTTKAR